MSKELTVPFHMAEAVFTADQIAKGGLSDLHDFLLAKAIGGPLKQLKDGRPYVIEIEPHKPQEIASVPGTYRIEVLIRYWLADYRKATINEFVYPPLLTADPKGENEQRFEATRDGMRFEPDAQGWRRVS
jgi:hypothetical protein